MSSIFLLFFVLAFSFSVNGQSISILEKGESNDSSYYDIFKVNDNEFWFGGKHGILKKVDSSGNISIIDYPNTGDHILNISSFDEDNIIITGDKGLVMLYDKNRDRWHKNYVDGFKRSSFYKVITINDTTAYISGGSSIVSFGGISIPFGFILKSIDKGKNWEKVYSNMINMIWDIIYDPSTDQLYASLFSPFKGNIISASPADDKWKKLGTGRDMLIHALDHDENLLLVGTSRKNINKEGIIDDQNEEKVYSLSNSGAVWSVNNSNGIKLFTASNGNIYYIEKGELLKVKVPLSKNLYESSNINSNSYYIVGSKKTLIRLDLPVPMEHVQNQ